MKAMSTSWKGMAYEKEMKWKNPSRRLSKEQLRHY